MKSKFLYLLVLCHVIIGCQKQQKIPIEISINTGWSFKGVDTLDWQSASVPGNIFTDLLAHQIIEDPFILNNEEKVQWVSEKDWLYQTNFNLASDILNKKHIELKFNGLDTYAEIYLNDSLLGKSNNAFRFWKYDIKNLAQKENHLKILFKNHNSYEKIKKENNPYLLPEGNRIFTRKAQFQYGWDWGPKLNTTGIWKSISLKAWDDYQLNSVFIKQENLTDSIAKLNLHLDEFSSLSDIDYECYVNNKLKAQSSVPNFSIQIINPKRWWTHNLGEPYLYDIKILVKHKGSIVDSVHTKYGLRTIKLITEKDSIGVSFFFELNGKPVYMKGSNYIPQNSFQNKVSDRHYHQLLNDVKDSNMNMLRVWGGGIYENDIFYDLCDEKGILVWQDFMFACAMYPGDKDFLNNVELEAKQQVKRLQNHASLALWCGNNENSEGWHRWGWQNNRPDEEKKAIWKDYLAVFDSILPNTVRKYSQTDYWESSPKYGRGNPKYEFEGDAHDWWVWHDDYPFEHFEKHVPRFMSEFGFQSFPSEAVINYINQKNEVDLKTKALQSHQKHIRGFELIDSYMQRDYPSPKNDEDYRYVSQLLQAKGITMGIKAHRRAKPKNMGTLYWQLNDCWPAISWSSIDYFGNWKALHYKVKKAYKNLIISAVKEDITYCIYLVNDHLYKLKDTLEIKIMDFYGNVIWNHSMDATLEKNSSQCIYQIPKGLKFNKENTLMLINFKDREEIYLFDKPKNLKLPKSKISIQTKKTSNGFSITLNSKVYQKDVYLSTKTRGKYSDNYFDILPNSPKIINFKTTENQLDTIIQKNLASI